MGANVRLPMIPWLHLQHGRFILRICHHEGLQGSAMLSLLPMIWVGGLMGAVFYTLVTGTASVENSRHVHQQDYWLARGKADTVLHQLLSQGSLPISQQRETFPNGIVTTTITKDTQWHVFVVAVGESGGMDTIHFSWNPVSKKITEWVDNRGEP